MLISDWGYKLKPHIGYTHKQFRKHKDLVMPRDGRITKNKIMDVAQSMVLDVGLVGMSIEKVIEGADVAKGTFFYHFKTKHDLAAAMIERYANDDENLFDETMEKAEQLSRDPLQQLLIFLGLLIDQVSQLDEPFPGCLYASYCYQSGAISEGIMDKVVWMIDSWRVKLGAKIEEVAIEYPPQIPIESQQVADHILTTFEGAFTLAKLMKDSKMAVEQLIQCRNYMELLFNECRGIPHP